jgi:hypothetical protein
MKKQTEKKKKNLPEIKQVKNAAIDTVRMTL